MATRATRFSWKHVVDNTYAEAVSAGGPVGVQVLKADASITALAVKSPFSYSVVAGFTLSLPSLFNLQKIL